MLCVTNIKDADDVTGVDGLGPNRTKFQRIRIKHHPTSAKPPGWSTNSTDLTIDVMTSPLFSAKRISIPARTTPEFDPPARRRDR
jgi:hypothetical protein